jgi:hypothetical protein
MGRARPAKADEQLRKRAKGKEQGKTLCAALSALSVLLTLTLIFGLDSFAIYAIARSSNLENYGNSQTG